MLLVGRWFEDLTSFRRGLDGVPAGSGLAHHEASGGLCPCRPVRGGVMTKRTSKHPRRSSRPPSPKAKPPPEHWLLRLLQRIPGVILKTGGLAAAIGAVVGLAVTILPSPSPKNVARFISVQTLSQIPLNQYQQRSATFAEQSAYYTHGQRRGLAAAIPGQTLAPLNGQDLPPTSPSAPATGTTPAAGTPSP